MLGPAIVILVVVVALAAAFAISTDGRYFGKGVSRWIYEVAGPTLFSLDSEEERWLGLANHLDLEEGEWLLDLGTAIGDLPISVASAHRPAVCAIGFELSQSMARRARANSIRAGVESRVHIVLGDASAPLPFAPKVFSAVTIFGLLETVRRPVPILREAYRVARSDGALAVSVYRGFSSTFAALNEGWYRSQLESLGQFVFSRAPLRRSQDVLLAQRGSRDDIDDP